MSQSLNQMPQHVARLAKSGHNLSQSYGFTSACAEIRPVYKTFLNPGESVYLSTQLLTRANPLMTPALADIEFHLDWFFVPASMLFTLFPSLSWMTDDRISSFFTAQVENFPLCNIDSMLSNSFGAGPTRESHVSSLGRVDRVGYTGDVASKARFRLAEDLGFNPFGIFKDYADFRVDNSDWETIDEEKQVKQLADSVNNPNVFPIFPLAYQCIYQKYFRNVDREPFDINVFNIDRLYNLEVFDHAAFDSSEELTMFAMRSVDRYKDYFTSIKPSPIMSGVSMLGSSSVADVSTTPSGILSKIDNWLSYSSTDLMGNNAFTSETDPETVSPIARGSLGENAGSVAYSGLSYKEVSPANIRSVFAIEKVLRITGRAAKDYDSQVLAHFGFKVPHDPKHEISHLGHDSGIMHIGEVISSADTYNDSNDTGSALGSMSGKGYLYLNGKKRKFVAPCHGVIMCTYYPLPRVRYYGGFDKQNSITDRTSFYWPEFDKLGMQPLMGYEFDGRTVGTPASSPVGWQFRYEQWKRKYDRVSYAFSEPSEQQKRQGIVNQYSSWVVAERPLSPEYRHFIYYGTDWNKSDIQWFNFKGNVHMLDNIMTMPYDSSFREDMIFKPWLLFDTDPFINDVRCNVKLVSTMSPTGEPDLDGI